MTSKSDNVMVLVRAITLECMKHNMVIKATHICGKLNFLCDFISRSQLQKFHQFAPQAEEQPEVIPNHLWKIFS